MFSGVVVYYVLALFISFLITFYLVPFLAEAAFRLNIIDHPDGKLKIHKAPTPYLGGVGIYLGFIVALSLVFPFENSFFLFLLGTTLLLFIGLLDDLIAMKSYQKFLGQCIALICFLKGGFFLKEVFLSSLSHYLWSYFWLIISAGWILSVINAFNLVDVMDGLATTLAFSIAISFLTMAYIFQVPVVMLLLFSFLGALAAFLWFNKPPARIYLGDAGSLFIGGTIAVIPFLMPWGTYTPYGFFALPVILFIPLCEVATLIIIRTYKGIPFYAGSPDHFSLYLQGKGWSKWTILAYVVTVQALLTVVALLFVCNYISLSNFIITTLLFAGSWYLMLGLIKVPIKGVAFLGKFFKNATPFFKNS
jgi:UDP-GlcNAc:undecaprenyl-phosphate GlcNAc-1-phosphate transferase